MLQWLRKQGASHAQLAELLQTLGITTREGQTLSAATISSAISRARTSPRHRSGKTGRRCERLVLRSGARARPLSRQRRGRERGFGRQPRWRQRFPRARQEAGRFCHSRKSPQRGPQCRPAFAACGCPAENSSRNPFHSPRSGRPIDDQDQIQVGTILRARRHQLSIHRSDRRREPCRKDAHGNLHHGIASQRRHSRALGTHRVQGCTADIISRSRHRF